MSDDGVKQLEALLNYWQDQAHRARRERDELREERDDARNDYYVLRQELAKIPGDVGDYHEASIASRRALDDELKNAQIDVAGFRKQRDHWRDKCVVAREQLDAERQTLKTDGDLLSDLIVNACPLWMTDEAARDLAEGVVADLARVGPGVVVLRGTNSEPWTPDDETETTPDTNTAASCTVNVTIGADEWCEYAVFVNATNPVDGAICLVDDCTTIDEALALAEHVPGAWVLRRIVTAQQWTTMTSPTPS